jgi:hypothetical protein
MITWSETVVAREQTHHLAQGRPLYEARFEEVLSFHTPGLAAVRDASGSFHIDLRGLPHYARRYQRTFGFYEGRAAVVDTSGAFHIDGGGEPISALRWAWCGNFQQGFCTVRGNDGLYLHVLPSGEPAYPFRFSYAGDFREGLAVAQDGSGFHFHIDSAGFRIGTAHYLDLDVFHKGFARARDAGGWFHLRRDGSPAYASRFAHVEPFYNGSARCERFDGALVVIDESGGETLQLRSTLPATGGRS